MTIKDLRRSLGDTQSVFSERYGIPFRTVQNWETGVNSPPQYVVNLLEQTVKRDLINRRLYMLPKWNSQKKMIPSQDEFDAPLEWLLAIKSILGDDIVYALDSSLICNGYYMGRTGDDVVWVYCTRDFSEYNGVYVIGHTIREEDIQENNGLRYTNFNRTLNDALANERILDLQGITEALNRYYFKNQESFSGLCVFPEEEVLFSQLKEDAIEYYQY